MLNLSGLKFSSTFDNRNTLPFQRRSAIKAIDPMPRCACLHPRERGHILRFMPRQCVGLASLQPLPAFANSAFPILNENLDLGTAF
jgi:hypothetical protein